MLEATCGLLWTVSAFDDWVEVEGFEPVITYAENSLTIISY